MNARSLLAAAAAFPACALAQVTEIPGMTVGTSTVLMSSLNAGPTSLTALRNAGTNGGAPIAAIALVPNTAANGFYNVNVLPTTTNPAFTDRALALDLQGGLRIINPLTEFDAFDLELDLEVSSTEFGIRVGDWLEGMELRFFAQGALVAMTTSSHYTTPATKFFQVSPAFDRVTVRAASVTANWVVQALHIQNSTPWQPIGVGCPGTNGTPSLRLDSPAELGSDFVLDLLNLPTTPGAFLISTGLSTTSAPGLGPLPFDLTPLGAPGCSIFNDFGTSALGFHGGTAAEFRLAIPNIPGLVGVEFANQGFVSDPTVNALGITVSNSGIATIQ